MITLDVYADVGLMKGRRKMTSLQGTRGCQVVNPYKHKKDRLCQWSKGSDHWEKKRERLHGKSSRSLCVPIVRERAC